MNMLKKTTIRLLFAGAFIATTSASVLLPATHAAAEEVYFIRGFANIWSRGMDQMVAKLRARGVNARSYSNGKWQGLAKSIIDRDKRGAVSYPIVIAGHSVGGQEAPKMANMLAKAGIHVSLVIGVDPGFGAPAPFTAGSPRVVNYWIKGSSRGNPYRSSGNFSGTIQNINIAAFTNADHVEIDKDSRVQSRIIDQVMATVGGSSGEGPSGDDTAQN